MDKSTLLLDIAALRLLAATSKGNRALDGGNEMAPGFTAERPACETKLTDAWKETAP